MSPAVDHRPETRPLLVLESRETFSDDLGGFGEHMPARGGDPADAKGMAAFVLRRLLVGLRRVGALGFPVWLWRGDADHGEPEIVLTFGDDRVVGIDLVPLAAHDDPVHRAALAHTAVQQAARRPRSGVSERWLCLADVEDSAEAADARTAFGGFLSNTSREAPIFRRICLVEPLHLTIVEAEGGAQTIDLSTDYDIDFAAWADEQARLAREKGVNALDLPHVAEELEDLGNSQRSARRSQLKRLLAHLLKLEHQHGYDGRRSWRLSCFEARQQLQRIGERNPSLSLTGRSRQAVLEVIDEAYEEARQWAARETEMGLEAFPESCPYTIDQILDPDFLPGTERDEDMTP
jgi:hypothetical protein